MSVNNTYKLRDASEQQINFGSPNGKLFEIRNAIRILYQVDCSFYYHAVEVKVVPMPRAIDPGIEAFRNETRTRKAIHLTMVTTYGVKSGKYAGLVQSEVTAEDLLNDC